MAPGDPPEKEGEIDFAHAIERAPGPERVSSLTRAILDTAPDGIVAIDVEGRVVEFNPAATRIFGWERDEVLGESLSELIVPPELREAHKRGFERFLKTGHGPVIGKRLELDALRNGGERFPIEMTITVVDEGPEPVFVAHLRDISGRYAAERAAAEAERENGPARRLCAFEVKAQDADVHAYEPIWLDGAVVGFCTSGGYSHHAQKSIALGFVPAERAKDGLNVEIEILGDMRKARLITTPLFDADGARMRG